MPFNVTDALDETKDQIKQGLGNVSVDVSVLETTVENLRGSYDAQSAKNTPWDTEKTQVFDAASKVGFHAALVVRVSSYPRDPSAPPPSLEVSEDTLLGALHFVANEICVDRKMPDRAGYCIELTYEDGQAKAGGFKRQWRKAVAAISQMLLDPKVDTRQFLQMIMPPTDNLDLDSSPRPSAAERKQL